jgi:hypothetical protein
MIKMTNYRTLEQGEKIESGDEYLLTTGEWEPVRSLVGATVGSCDIERGKIRREIFTHYEILKDAFNKCGIKYFELEMVDCSSFLRLELDHGTVDFDFNANFSFEKIDFWED